MREQPQKEGLRASGIAQRCAGGASGHASSSASDDEVGGLQARCASSLQKGRYFLINDRSTYCMMPPLR